ncbi:MAG: putative lipid II flippase FtsW [Proteobacteria bacterium]|jgi:cell division protein FtsW|nr:putative lipid II flippase FtsW [Pseudomonadota bacterium]MDA1034536.1 putative lipid II flippase FtsW [Pseudomonadota bacterium]
MQLRNSFNQPNYDPFLLWIIIMLSGVGLVMVYSSSVDVAALKQISKYQNYYYLLRHSIYLTISIVCGLIAFLIPINFWQKFAPTFFVFGILLLIAVLVPGIGKTVNGSQRWIPIGIMNFQPSELVKLLTIIYAADYVLRKSRQIGTFARGFLPMSLAIALVGSLLIYQPDFGALVVVICISMGILFLGGISLKIIFGLMLSVPIAMYSLLKIAPYRVDRITTFLSPFEDLYGKGWQLSHSLIAIGRGDFFGVGLGESIQKLQYLPEAHTDFILAILAEELGLLGFTMITVLYAVMIIRIFGISKISTQLRNNFSALLAQGIGLWFGIQAAINIGVNVGFFPTKGLTLPFVSYGGSALLVTFIASGILMRIDYENKIKAKRN